MACKSQGATRLLTCISSRWVVGHTMGGNLGPKVVGRLFNCGHRLEAGAAFSVLLSIAEASLASHSQPSLLRVETESKFWVELRPGRYQQQKCPMAKHRQRRSVEPGSVSWSLFLAESLNHCCLSFWWNFLDQWSVSKFFCDAAIKTFWAKQIEPTVWITFISGFEKEELKMYW